MTHASSDCLGVGGTFHIAGRSYSLTHHVDVMECRVSANPIPARLVAATTALIGLLSVATGGWAIAAPVTFYRFVAPFPPYSMHLIHDIGAFQLGLGACLLAGLLLRDALLAVLAGNSVGAAAHFASHLMDRADGGHSSDPLTIGALALLLGALTAARWAIVRQQPAMLAGPADTAPDDRVAAVSS